MTARKSKSANRNLKKSTTIDSKKTKTKKTGKKTSAGRQNVELKPEKKTSARKQNTFVNNGSSKKVDRIKPSKESFERKDKSRKKTFKPEKIQNKQQSNQNNNQNTNVWDTLGIPNIKDAVKKTTDSEGFKWAVFFASAAGILVILLILYLGTKFFLKKYNVETVYVEGSTHYSNDEIKNMVMEGPLGTNSLYLGLKYKDKAIEGVPFVQRMDVEIIDANSIRIRVYEKAIAGYFEHLGKFVYFDKDGIVIETSDKETTGVPLVTGLKFNYVVMYEPLPVDKKEIFEDILDITQLLKKYEISADRIYFDSDNKKTLYFGKARVSLGTNDNIDEKILKLKYILPKLEGLSGVLRMDNYAEGVTNITFEEDKE